ncbi:MAG: sigma-54 interaction domain-containing protein [Bacillota bacterium]
MSDFPRNTFDSQCPEMKSLLELIPKIAKSGANILIQGESGTGKEVLARHIHQVATHGATPFVAINCAAIPENLLESELFGHRKGSFSGAISDHKGIFEMASGGTIFLDEIGDMPLNLQAKILRVLQERSIRPVGSTSERKVNFSLIAATHRDLTQEVRIGRFREDLFYRLNVIPLHIKPLRDRKEDISILAQNFALHFSNKYNHREQRLSTQSLDFLMSYSWPGNVRELENFIERAIVMQPMNTILEPNDLPVLSSNEWQPFHETFSNLPSLSSLVESYIKYVLEHVDSHQGKAAEILGVSRRTLSRRAQNSTATKNLESE